MPVARLEHADAPTTLREYSYTLPLTAQAVAEQIGRRLAQPPTGAHNKRGARPDPSSNSQWASAIPAVLGKACDVAVKICEEHR